MQNLETNQAIMKIWLVKGTRFIHELIIILIKRDRLREKYDVTLD